MSVQDISIANNQRKRLLKAINDDTVLFEDESGDLVVSVAAYNEFKRDLDPAPLESIVGAKQLDFSVEFFVFH
ncbi:hypothetical protein EDC56_1559 [Sinobacterium caligoides]|uniref:Uncharacterized protein n=1 Tax=Sinobacterium caligoides TaxID=933926 RepID=A0A3N2DMU2_9GAMM|nr:hypothetical protein [Sinobacterium caligoides]ROS01131.1 hypothetical protein EDC56_1559 [Sinobacterium caligoides]